jgi:cytochrome c-type protein NapB
MIFHRIVASLVLMVAASPITFAAQPIQADSMGLSKGSVFEVPAPKVYTTKAGQPGQNKVLPRAYLNAPPQIPHDIGDFLPITAQSNMCIACHAQPDQWGKEREKGVPTPIPPSHYTDRRNAPDKVTDHLINARFNCNQCHVPQMDAVPLVENTFSAKRAR